MEKLTISSHWTSRSTRDFTHRIASDFLAQVETRLETGEISRCELAQRLKRTPGRVSQLFNAANMNLESAVRLAYAVGMKVALVAYDDGDAGNSNGPVNSEIFSKCWQQMGSPTNLFELSRILAPVQEELGYWHVASTNADTDDLPIEPLRLTHKAINRPTA